ncbi:FKBP-type peptidyl-prolyl cis-trans isomerase [candidate division WOR-3 bacterium]|nr:FKBP-type peptidyl-prolyl cis-trans isomerase [candidate division WOR-3 bacterium]
MKLMIPNAIFSIAMVLLMFLLVGCESEEKTEKLVLMPSGLQYVDMVIGTGASPTIGSRVSVHYTGWLEDGTMFDSSKKRDKPFIFTLGQGQVIKGWDEGVVSMKVGGKRKLIIPSKLGYGEYGAGDAIPPNAILIFEIELLKIK